MNTPNLSKLFITNQTTEKIDPGIFESVFQILEKGEKIPNGKTVDLVLCNNDAIQRINKKFRGVNKPTDVISFKSDFCQSDSLGEIIIDLNTAEMQRGDKSLKRELQELFLHGFLHILGYDHISAKDKNTMSQIENKYLKAL